MKEIRSFLRYVKKRQNTFFKAFSLIESCYEQPDRTRAFTGSFLVRSSFDMPTNFGWEALKDSVVKNVGDMIDRHDEKDDFPALRDIFMELAPVTQKLDSGYTVKSAFLQMAVRHLAHGIVAQEEYLFFLRDFTNFISSGTLTRRDIRPAQEELKQMEEALALYEKHEELLFLNLSSPFLWVTFNYSVIVYFVALVESVFLEKGLSRDLFYYMRLWDVRAVRYLDIREVAAVRGWTEQYTYQLAKGYPVLSFYSRFARRGYRDKFMCHIKEIDDYVYAMTDGLVNDRFRDTFYDQYTVSFHKKCEEIVARMKERPGCGNMSFGSIIKDTLAMKDAVYPDSNMIPADVAVFHRAFENTLERFSPTSVEAPVTTRKVHPVITQDKKSDLIKQRLRELKKTPGAWFLTQVNDQHWKFSSEGNCRYLFVYFAHLIRVKLTMDVIPWKAISELVEISYSPKTLKKLATELRSGDLESLPSGRQSIKEVFKDVNEEDIFK